MGLYINNARRQTKDKTLARRMKDLLKEWKILVQNSQSNGVATPSQLTTPIPSISPAPLSTTPTLAPSEESSSESGVINSQKQNPQLSHRKLLLNKLSAFKKPQTTPTATPPTVEPVNTSHLLPQVSLPPLHVNNGKPGSTNNSLTIRYPLDRLPKQQETRGQLVVSISLSLIKLSGCSEALPTEGVSLLQPGPIERSSPLSFQSLSPVSFQETRSSPLPPLSFPPPSLSLPPSPSPLTPPLIVSISLSLLTSPTLVPAARKPLPTTIQQVHEEEEEEDSSSSSFSVTLTTSSVSGKTMHSISPEWPTSRLKGSPPLSLPPPNCLPGYDGTVGLDGNWYSWTDVIQYPKPMVTVLPYVYIDGFDPNEM